MSTPLLLEFAPKIDTNPTIFFTGGEVGGSLRLQAPVICSRSALAMSVHPTYFDLATPLYLRCIGVIKNQIKKGLLSRVVNLFKSVNSWQSYKQEGGCLVH